MEFITAPYDRSVDRKDNDTARYYKCLGFVETNTNPLRLALSTGTLIQGYRTLEASEMKIG